MSTAVLPMAHAVWRTLTAFWLAVLTVLEVATVAQVWIGVGVDAAMAPALVLWSVRCVVYPMTVWALWRERPWAEPLALVLLMVPLLLVLTVGAGIMPNADLRVWNGTMLVLAWCGLTGWTRWAAR